MNRRTLLWALVAGALPWRLGRAQQASPRRIGYLETTSLPGRFDAFRQGLRDLGYVEGRDIVIELISAEGNLERLPALASELISRKVDVIAAAATPATLAARNATKSIPIVMLGVGDPVGSGLVKSLAQPGGNITGTSFLGTEVVGKQLQLLKEAFPRISRVGVLWNPANRAYSGLLLQEAKTIAPSLALAVNAYGAKDAPGLEDAFRSMSQDRIEALVVLGDVGLLLLRKQIVALAAAGRLPAIYGANDFADVGGLMSYAARLLEQYRRGAGYVDRILRGAKAGDLPIERPTQFDLVINLKTAKTLGLTFPQPILLRADRVIE